MATNKDLFIAALFCVASATIVSMLILPIWITATHVLLVILMVIIYRVKFTSPNTFQVIDWFYSTTFVSFLIKVKDKKGNIKVLLSDKPVHIGSFMALLLVMFLSSCSNEKPAITDANRNIVYYKVQTLENSSVFVASSIEPAMMNEYAFVKGDTTWVNMNTQRIDQQDSLAMKVVILKRMSTLVLDSTGHVIVGQ